jgi:hypothetical protein
VIALTTDIATSLRERWYKSPSQARTLRDLQSRPSPAKERAMLRTILLVGLIGLTAGCSATPLVTKSRMTLGEANIDDMECRRGLLQGSNIPKTVCASEAAWNASEKRQADLSQAFLDKVQSANDNRILYPR